MTLLRGVRTLDESDMPPVHEKPEHRKEEQTRQRGQGSAGQPEASFCPGQRQGSAKLSTQDGNDSNRRRQMIVGAIAQRSQ